MTRYLFLKAEVLGSLFGSRRQVQNAGIDPRLMSLMSARYV